MSILRIRINLTLCRFGVVRLIMKKDYVFPEVLRIDGQVRSVEYVDWAVVRGESYPIVELDDGEVVLISREVAKSFKCNGKFITLKKIQWLNMCYAVKDLHDDCLWPWRYESNETIVSAEFYAELVRFYYAPKKRIKNKNNR